MPIVRVKDGKKRKRGSVRKGRTHVHLCLFFFISFWGWGQGVCAFRSVLMVADVDARFFRSLTCRNGNEDEDDKDKKKGRRQVVFDDWNGPAPKTAEMLDVAMAVASENTKKGGTRPNRRWFKKVWITTCMCAHACAHVHGTASTHTASFMRKRHLSHHCCHHRFSCEHKH